MEALHWLTLASVTEKPEGTLFELAFVVDCGAAKIGKAKYVLSPEIPLQIRNKAKSYSQIRKTGRNPWGGPEWEAMKLFEAAVRLRAIAAARAFERSTGVAWPADLVDYEVWIGLVFGALVVDVQAGPAGALRRHSRRISGDFRRRRSGIDKNCQAVLDGLQPAVVLDDERIFVVTEDKRAPALETIGDVVRISAAVWRPAGTGIDT